jgi:hypothetical protein
MHVGVLDRPGVGRISDWMQKQITFKIFLFYAGLLGKSISDQILRETTLKIIGESDLDKVVCLALDPVYDDSGNRREDLSHMWVDNSYIIELRDELGTGKILPGASVHPYDPQFETRLESQIDQGAVLLKWLPSAQHIELADERVLRALKHTATAGQNNKPLPVLIHIGPEYAIITTDPRTTSYDFLSWSRLESAWNRLRPRSRRWATPDIKKRLANLTEAVEEGAHIILAHAGLPYFASGSIGKYFEHSDFEAVKKLLHSNRPGQGAFYTDVSACCTPFRQVYHKDIAGLPPEYILFGSDFPVPIFELSADLKEHLRDFKAIMHGKLERIVKPQGNLLDVNYRELARAFPDHPMFGNFVRLV